MIAPAQAIKAQRTAEIALEIVRGGRADPDLLADTVLTLNHEEVRDFMRGIQKTIEHAGRRPA